MSQDKINKDLHCEYICRSLFHAPNHSFILKCMYQDLR